MTTYEFILALVAGVGIVMSSVGMVLGLMSRRDMKEIAKAKGSAQVQGIQASTTDQLVSAALSIKDDALELNAPLRKALASERQTFQEEIERERQARNIAVTEERRLREEALAAGRLAFNALEVKMAAELKMVTDEMKIVKRRNAELTEWVGLLVGQLHDANIVPVPDPGDKRK